MARDLRLVRVEHFDEEADAYLVCAYQVDQTKAGSIS
jgi:hypothetical protein